jgi:hypothetical protein
MKSFYSLLFLLCVGISQLFCQQFQVHSRGMLHQTVFNDGSLGRFLDAGKTSAILGQPSFEWPSNNGHSIYLSTGAQTSYAGYYNSFGGGFYIAGDTAKLIPSMGKTSPRVWVECGGFTDASGNNMPGNSIPLYARRLPNNYPLLDNGQLNPAYDPNEAEEVIESKWETPLGITVTRTSRAWSYPDYDDFIIYDYQLENTGHNSLTGRTDTIRAMTIAYTYNWCNSMIGGMLLNNNAWAELPFRDDKAGAKGFQYARYNWTRWMMYNHTINGLPYQPVAGGDTILTAPGAIGILPLYYDFTQLASKAEVTVALATGVPATDSLRLWEVNFAKDPSGKTKTLRQPYNVSWDNGNQNIDKFKKYLDIEQTRQNTPFRSSVDSAKFGTYWIGRGRPNHTNTLRNPTGKWYGFGPYTFLPGQTMHFVVAEVAGFGPGSAWDAHHYEDLGGGTGSNAPAEPTPGTHPVASWFDTTYYNFLNDQPTWSSDPTGTGFGKMGTTFMQGHKLPDYVNSTKTITLRNVADRAIQMYTGDTLIHYDTLQYEPKNAPLPTIHHYNRISIPCPAPVILVKNTFAASNRVIWGPQVESFTVTPPAKLNAPFSHYQILQANNPMGPWIVLADSIGKRDPRYFRDTLGLDSLFPLDVGDSVYCFLDMSSDPGSGYFYAVVSVDSLGAKSGKTNTTYHLTQAPARSTLTKVWAAPNPFIVTSHVTQGTSANGNISNQIRFYGLTYHCTIRIFSYSGQLVQTIQHDADGFEEEWFQISRNVQWVSSGVYYFVVEDNKTGARAWNKFVIIH